MTIEEVARICHETNRAYCLALGDTSQKAWEEAPEWQRESAINGVKFHKAALDKGETPSPSASHESWLREKTDTGWSYGRVKDEAKKEHPCYVPYNKLPLTQQLKDSLFGAVVHTLYKIIGQ